MTRRVWGYVYDDEVPAAAYFVEWTPGHLHKFANFDLILGKWGENASPAHRKAVALAFQQREDGPAFMVIDAASRPVGSSEIVGEALDRERVIGKPIAQKVFAICDTIFLQDQRIAPLREGNG